MTQHLLHRIDPSRNMARFYLLSLQPTLFGEVSVVRSWGRIGTAGRSKVESHTTGQGACLALAKLKAAKLRRGYRGEAG